MQNKFDTDKYIKNLRASYQEGPHIGNLFLEDYAL